MNGQKCTNKDCLYLHEIRTDLEAYTKEDMQNNKFIFQEQQKIAIKLSRALEMSLEEFQQYNRLNNKALPSDPGFRPILPSPDNIYYKDFHFLDEPLINRKYPKPQETKAPPLTEQGRILQSLLDDSVQEIEAPVVKVSPEVEAPSKSEPRLS